MAETHAKILKRVYRLIEQDEERFVCFALFDRPSKSVEELRDRYRIKNWIDDILGSCATLDYWLKIRGYNDGDTEKVKETRLAWVHWMIKNHHIFDVPHRF